MNKMTSDQSLLITNVRLRESNDLHFIAIEKAKIATIAPMQGATLPTYERSIDGEGGLVLPPFIDSHLHYDSSLTAGEPRWNSSGTLMEAIACNGERQAAATREEFTKRTLQAVKWQAIQGVQYARIHADVSDPELKSLKALLEIREDLKHYIDIQIVAFPQMGIMRKPRYLELMEEALQLGVDGVGGAPHLELTREHGVASIKMIFDLAEQYDKFIDVHCDETDDEHSRFVEVMAAEAIQRGMGARTSASHVTALHSYNNAYAAKVINLIRDSGMSVVSNPVSNLVLQGRFDSFPVRRGVTRVKPLLEAGVNVSLGHDNLVDAFYSLGTGGILPVLHMGLHACHMLGYDDLQHALDLITVNAAKTLGLGNEMYGLAESSPANLIIMQAPNSYETIRTQLPVRFSVRHGQVLVDNPAQQAWVAGPDSADGESVSLLR
jgi:cytosine deaminase